MSGVTPLPVEARHKLRNSPLVDEVKRAAARVAVAENWPSKPQFIGIGSGTTIKYVIEKIQELKEIPENTVFVPTGHQSRQLILDAGLRLGTVDGIDRLDVAFDGADECDNDLNLIKGGGACLFQEKLISILSDKFVIIADFRKRSARLGTQFIQGVPIEVVPISYRHVMSQLRKIHCREPVLRDGGAAKAGPVITDNGNFLIDAVFENIQDPAQLYRDIKKIFGVVDVGLFIDAVDVVYFGEENGNVERRTRDKQITIIKPETEYSSPTGSRDQSVDERN